MRGGAQPRGQFALLRDLRGLLRTGTVRGDAERTGRVTAGVLVTLRVHGRGTGESGAGVGQMHRPVTAGDARRTAVVVPARLQIRDAQQHALRNVVPLGGLRELPLQTRVVPLLRGRERPGGHQRYDQRRHGGSGPGGPQHAAATPAGRAAAPEGAGSGVRRSGRSGRTGCTGCTGRGVRGSGGRSSRQRGLLGWDSSQASASRPQRYPLAGHPSMTTHEAEQLAFPGAEFVRGVPSAARHPADRGRRGDVPLRPAGRRKTPGRRGVRGPAGRSPGAPPP
jgi:hypothetical protein